MAIEDDLTPHLGKIRDAGRPGGKRFARQVKAAARRLSQPKSKSEYTGRHVGAGGAKARQLSFHARRLAEFRTRRVVVKVHIARAARSGGVGAFRAHINYIQRDGVDREGLGGEIYAKDGCKSDLSSFLERSSGDRHQFRIIISPEDGDKLGNLRTFTREFMDRVETDLGKPIEWVAVDHHNTGQPHTHVVIRGRDIRGQDLVIAPEYIKSGLRTRARVLATEILGPRRDVEIARARYSETQKDRFTQIDRDIIRGLERNSGKANLKLKLDQPNGFHRTLMHRRLKHLSGLGLARETTRNRWFFSPKWDDTLRALGRRGDIIRSLASKYDRQNGHERLELFDPVRSADRSLKGTVLASVPKDELTGTRSIILEDENNTRWIVDIGEQREGAVPPENAIVEFRPKEIQIGAADQTISMIANQEDGRYSEALHKAYDPTSSVDYQKAHVRRLEALRRQGIVNRGKDGVWSVPNDYLSKVHEYEQKRSGAHKLVVHSWISLEKQVAYPGPTWLDEVDASGLSAKQKKAFALRQDWLRENGWLVARETRLSKDARDRLAAKELALVQARISNQSGRASTTLGVGEEFQGRYEGSINLGTRRLARIGNAKEFVLVPWRRSIERAMGQDMVARRTTEGVSWRIGRRRDRGVGF